MGFSLKRALAGALAGGAGAIGEIADARIKEAQQERERQAAFARQRELLEIQDEIASQRELRVEASKQRLEDAKVERIGGFMRDSRETLKKEGIDPGSAAGQRRLAEMALENKQPMLADKFFDNAIRMDQISETSALRRAEIAARSETARLARGSAKSDGDYAKGLAYAGKIGARISIPGRDGKPVKIPEGASYMEGLYRDAIENGKTPAEAIAALNRAHTEIAKGLPNARKVGVDPLDAIETMLDIFKANDFSFPDSTQPSQNQKQARSSGGASGSWDEYTPSVAGKLRNTFGLERAGSMGFNDVMPQR